VSRRSSRETLIGSICFSVLAGSLLIGTDWADYRIVVMRQCILAAVFIIAAVYNDEMAERLRRIGVWLLPLSILAAAASVVYGKTDLWGVAFYASGLTAFTWIYGQLLREPLYLIMAAIHVFAATTAGAVMAVHAFFQLPLAPGVRHAIVAAVSFVLASHQCLQGGEPLTQHWSDSLGQTPS